MKPSFGLGPSPGLDRISRYLEPLRAYLISRTQLEGLTIVVREAFTEVADDLEAGRLSFGWLPAVTFARSDGKKPARPDRLTNPELDGPHGRRIKLLLQAIRGDSSSYFSVLFVRDDSPAATLADLRGKRIAWVSRDSSAGYVLAAHALAESGVQPGWESFEGSHAAVVRAVASGEADAGATFCSIDPQLRPNRIRSAGWTETVEVANVRFRPIETFGPIPGDVLCASPDTTYGQRAMFASVMARMHLDPEGVGIVRGLFGADRFDIARPRHFQQLRLATEQLAQLDHG
jgi:phosphonate transport system substrate-binding protein